MNYIITFITVVCIFLSGWFSHGILNEGEIREVKVVEYQTEYKIRKVGMPYNRVTEYMFSPLTIDHKIYDNKITIHAYDRIKENKKVIGFKCASANGWDMYFTVGAICLVAGVAGTMYLLR